MQKLKNRSCRIISNWIIIIDAFIILMLRLRLYYIAALFSAWESIKFSHDLKYYIMIDSSFYIIKLKLQRNQSLKLPNKYSGVTSSVVASFLGGIINK